MTSSGQNAGAQSDSSKQTVTSQVKIHEILTILHELKDRDVPIGKARNPIDQQFADRPGAIKSLEQLKKFEKYIDGQSKGKYIGGEEFAKYIKAADTFLRERYQNGEISAKKDQRLLKLTELATELANMEEIKDKVPGFDKIQTLQQMQQSKVQVASEATATMTLKTAQASDVIESPNVRDIISRLEAMSQKSQIRPPESGPKSRVADSKQPTLKQNPPTTPQAQVAPDSQTAQRKVASTQPPAPVYDRASSTKTSIYDHASPRGTINQDISRQPSEPIYDLASSTTTPVDEVARSGISQYSQVRKFSDTIQREAEYETLGKQSSIRSEPLYATLESIDAVSNPMYEASTKQRTIYPQAVASGTFIIKSQTAPQIGDAEHVYDTVLPRRVNKYDTLPGRTDGVPRDYALEQMILLNPSLNCRDTRETSEVNPLTHHSLSDIEVKIQSYPKRDMTVGQFVEKEGRFHINADDTMVGKPIFMKNSQGQQDVIYYKNSNGRIEPDLDRCFIHNPNDTKVEQDLVQSIVDVQNHRKSYASRLNAQDQTKLLNYSSSYYSGEYVDRDVEEEISTLRESHISTARHDITLSSVGFDRMRSQAGHKTLDTLTSSTVATQRSTMSVDADLQARLDALRKSSSPDHNPRKRPETTRSDSMRSAGVRSSGRGPGE